MLVALFMAARSIQTGSVRGHTDADGV